MLYLNNYFDSSYLNLDVEESVRGGMMRQRLKANHQFYYYRQAIFNQWYIYC